MLGRQAAATALAVAAVGIAWAGVAAGAKAPVWRSVAPTSLGISFHLTSDWGITNHASLDRGWKWEAFSPGQIAWLRLTTVRTTLPFEQVSVAAVSRLRVETAQGVQADPNGFFRSTRLTVAGMPATRVEIRGYQVTAFGVQETTTVEVTFVRAGVAFLLEFDTEQKFAARFVPTVRRALSTLHLTQIA
jgi:hypothetical protein